MREERKAGTEGRGLAAHAEKVNAILKALLKPEGKGWTDIKGSTTQRGPSPRSKQVGPAQSRACCQVTWGGSGGGGVWGKGERNLR